MGTVARAARALIAGAAVALTCACAQAHLPGRSRTADVAQVESALRRYSDLVLAMDNAGIAALFEPEGEIEREGQEPVHGREAILAFLSTFSGYKVLSNSAVAEDTVVDGDMAEQIGSYRQTVRAPDGKVLEVSGPFRAVWGRTADGAWLIRSMGTAPDE